MPRFSKTHRLAAAAVVAATATAVVATGAAAVGVQEIDRDDAKSGAARAHMYDAQGNFLGTVRFLPRGGGKVAVRAVTASLPAGFHGFHVHAVGSCQPPFTSAGGHYNPTSAGHGAHAGDMPVLFAAKDGLARAEFQTDAFTIEELLDADGSAVIVHAGPDNYANIPARYAPSGPDATTLATGDAGARIACGVVEKR